MLSQSTTGDGPPPTRALEFLLLLLLHCRRASAAVDGPFPPVTVPPDKSFRGNALDLPVSFPPPEGSHPSRFHLPFPTITTPSTSPGSPRIPDNFGEGWLPSSTLTYKSRLQSFCKPSGPPAVKLRSAIVSWVLSSVLLRFMQPLISRGPIMVIEGNHEMEEQAENQTFVACGSRFAFPSEESGSSSTLCYSFNAGAEQYAWLADDLSRVNREVTPWLMGHMEHPLGIAPMQHITNAEGLVPRER